MCAWVSVPARGWGGLGWAEPSCCPGLVLQAPVQPGLTADPAALGPCLGAAALTAWDA